MAIKKTKKSNAGRPKKLSSTDFKRISEEYLAECKETGQIPFLGELAVRCGVSADTVTEYSKSPLYSPVVKRVKQHTENGLIRKGLNENKPVFPIFLLKSLFSYVEANKLDITSNGETLGVIELPQRKA